MWRSERCGAIRAGWEDPGDDGARPTRCRVGGPRIGATQAVRRCHSCGLGIVTQGQVDHLAGAAGHAGEEGGGAVVAGRTQQGDADQAGEAGEQGAGQQQAAVGQHLLQHRRAEVQADAGADQPLPALARAGHFAQVQAAQAAQQDHRQQGADHPRQRPADQAGQGAAGRTGQRREPPLRHARHAASGACAASAGRAGPASAGPGPTAPR